MSANKPKTKVGRLYTPSHLQPTYLSEAVQTLKQAYLRDPDNLVKIWEEDARNDLTWFAEYTSHGNWQPARHLILIAQALEAVERGDIKRLIISAPPRSGKSQIVSRIFPAWYLGRNPNKELIQTSYSAELATDLSGASRNRFIEWGRLWGLQISDSSSAVHSWSVKGHDGGMKAAGVGGPLTGRGGDCLTPDTIIATDRGSVDLLTLLNTHPAPKILTYNHKARKYAYGTLIAHNHSRTDKLVELITENGHTILCTTKHKIYDCTKKNYRRANLFRVGDVVLCNTAQPYEGATPALPSGKVRIPRTVPHTERIVYAGRVEVCNQDVYDIQVEPNNNFFANGMLTHNCIIVDDPIKNQAEALSPAAKNKLWQWYLSTLYSRLSPEGRIVVVATRWAQDDLVGRLLEDEQYGGDKWVQIKLTALAEEGDILGRSVNEPLWPERGFDFARMEQVRKTIKPFWWSAMYQQNPIPEEGDLFLGENLRVTNTPPELHQMRLIRFWDLAATEASYGKDPDWTVGALVGIYRRNYYLMDIKRVRTTPFKVEQLIKRTADEDGREVTIHIEQEPGASGVAVAERYADILQGFAYKSVAARGTKVARASVLSSIVESGKFYMVRAGWNDELKSEMISFPNGKHDDQVDALSGAVVFLSGMPNLDAVPLIVGKNTRQSVPV